MHITRFDGQQAPEEEAAAAAAGGAGPNKPVTCLWYDLGGKGAASTAAAKATATPESGDLAFLDTPGAFVFLGASKEGFLSFVQQELGQPGATEAALAEARVPDLGAEKVS